MKCQVCGHELKEESYQCRKCGSLNKTKRLRERLKIFARLNELELQNQKQAVVIMKLWKEVQEKNEPHKIVKDGDSFGTTENFIDYILKL